MTEPNRYAVPLDRLDDVRVATSEQVQEQRAADSPDGWSWAGPQLHPFADGAADVDGD